MCVSKLKQTHMESGFPLDHKVDQATVEQVVNDWPIEWRTPVSTKELMEETEEEMAEQQTESHVKG